VVDLETTGFKPVAGWSKTGRFHPAAEITEVGLVRLLGPVIQGTFQHLAAVEGDLPVVIQRLTGITPHLLAGAPSWEHVALKLMPELEGRTWVAHHAAFDGAFLKAWLPQGLWHRHRLVCTKRLAKALAPEVGRYSLHQLCAHFGIVNSRAHRALADAQATAELLQHLMARAEAQGLDGEAFLKLGEVPWTKL
jgi:DNA polymerase III epsilon subunit-like protein